MIHRALAVLVLAAPVVAQGDDLARGFQSPPPQARPHSWWHWMNGNITREGITADLEAMRRVGIGGAQIFNVSESIPPGPILYNSPEWRALFTHAASEAQRLGIELCMHNCAGWSSSGGPWITPELAMQKVANASLVVQGPTPVAVDLPTPPTAEGYYRDIAILAFPTPADADARIKDINAKAGYEPRYNQQPSMEPAPIGSVIPRSAIIDLSSRVSSSGRLEWDAPAGSWTILRIGHTPTGARNAPSPESGRGLECDKLSRDGLEAHWAGGLEPLFDELGPLAGGVLNNCLIDSYEMGGQNWTPSFRAEFQARRGYDMLPYLPVITGRYVESAEASERFLWDFRRTIGDLFSDNYYTAFAELCHERGIRASIEPYDGPFECMQVGQDADIPMGEFWVGGGESTSCKLAASVGHVYGRTIIGAESFTAMPDVGRWLNHPASLKAVGDLMYTVGINRYIIHRYAHQPWLGVAPGMTMGQWGTHFERTTTWWNQGSAWLDYLARCQHLLQQGEFVGDVLYFTGDSSPADAPLHLELKAMGHDYDSCGPDVLFNRLRVQDGLLCLPTGASYRVLVLPDSEFMLPATLERIRDLVGQGATVIGPRPVKSPSLGEFPECDLEVARLAAELWGADPAPKHRFGKGRVIAGRSPQEVLADAGVTPDCAFTGMSGRIAWIHRRAGDADIYFVSSQSRRSQTIEASFRVTGKAPELWHADTGEIEAAPVWSEHDGRVRLPIDLDPAGSVFVVFRKPASGATHLASFAASGGAAGRAAPKLEIVRAVYEAQDGAGGADVTGKVAAIVAAGETTIPASNSTFGDPVFNHVKRLRLEYTLNGTPMSATCEENQSIDLVDQSGPDHPQEFRLARRGRGIELTAFCAGRVEYQRFPGKPRHVDVPSLPPPVELAGPWRISFPPGLGAPASVTLDQLGSWTRSQDPGVRYFSGTAEYSTEFTLPPDMLGPGQVLVLDLGVVHEIAEVTLNGTGLGIWWKPPFSADITDAAAPGKNMLTIRVTNLWTNRLIGDEQLPDDCEWNGKPLKRWPDWFVNHTPRPSRDRVTFTTWRHYTKDSPLVDSGLLGPVRLRSGLVMPIVSGSQDQDP